MRKMIAALRRELDENKTAVTAEHAKRLGNKLKVDWNKVDLDQLRSGIAVEKEHGRGPMSVIKKDGIKYAKIALAHLKEKPDYYTRLRKMERE